MTTRKDQALLTRERLLTAAMRTLQRTGPHGFTLDEVAREATVSKGGLLHHFGSKRDLLQALVQQVLATFTERVHGYHAADPRPPGSLTRAYIRATFGPADLAPELGVLLLVAVLDDAALQTIIQDDAQAWQQRLLDDGLPPGRVLVIRNACDATWTEKLLGIAVLDLDHREHLVTELLALAAGGPR